MISSWWRSVNRSASLSRIAVRTWRSSLRAGADGNLDVLKTILEDPSLRQAEVGSARRLIGDFYAACVDTTTVDGRGMTPIDVTDSIWS